MRRYPGVIAAVLTLGLLSAAPATASQSAGWNCVANDVETNWTVLASGDMLVAYSDGITEAEGGHDDSPFDELGLRAIIEGDGWATAKELGWETFAAVERHSGARRLRDDLTVLVARRLPPLPT